LPGGSYRNAIITGLTERLAQPQSAMVLLEILTYLPDEADSRRLRASHDKKKQALYALAQFAPALLQLLMKFMEVGD